MHRDNNVLRIEILKPQAHEVKTGPPQMLQMLAWKNAYIAQNAPKSQYN